MRLAFLAPANSIHTQRWAVALANRGVSILLVSQHDSDTWVPPDRVRIHRLRFSGNSGYFLNALELRALLDRERPDLLHVHYASGYGTLGMLSNFAPSLLSVWGSDVYEFPLQARWKMWLLRRNLRWATRIASTSEAMAQQVRLLTPETPSPLVTPFGVDCEKFAPCPRLMSAEVRIGTVKTLSHKYGIDILIAAFAEVLRARRAASIGLEQQLRLVIVGGGEQEDFLRVRARQLGVVDNVQFVGYVRHEAVPSWLQTLDIYVAVSRSESFGVAVIEAAACGLPAVVSDVGGLPEVVQDGITGIVVPSEDVSALSQALHTLIQNRDLREAMGAAGRDFVLRQYEWTTCVDRMLEAQRLVLESYSRCE